MFKVSGKLVIAIILIIYCGLFTNAFAAPTLEQALDVDTLVPPLTFITGGDANWFGQTGHSVWDGVDAAQSGHITHEQTSWMQTTVTGPGDLSFIWLVSSENGYDWLTFYVDELEQSAISGETFGAPYSFGNPPLHLSDTDTHTLKWAYKKDNNDVYPIGSDAGWVDNVVWTPSNPQYTLTVTKAGTGSGTVTSDSIPYGIDCGSTCSVNYNSFQSLALTATADTGSTFTGWSGGVCSGTDPCIIGMSAAQNVTATFTNGSAPAGSIQLSSATYSVSESGGTVTVTATRTGGSSGAVGVSYATSDGTATAGSDYTAAVGTVSWADGDTVDKTFTVPVLNDSAYEGNETFTVTLSNATGGATLGSPGSATVTITDDDPAPAGSIQLSSATYSVAENNGTVTITATRTGGSNGAVGVSYATSNGTATAGSDYTAAGGTLSWSNGDTANKTFTVTVLNDSTYEGNETFTVTLSNATGGATLGSPAGATVTITDDDPLPGSILINNGDAWTKSTTVTLTLTANSSNPPLQMCISNTTSCTSWQTFASSKAWTLTAGNGTKTVSVWFKDATTPAGTPYTASIGYDNIAPVNGTVTVTPGPGQNALSWSVFTDALSGVTGYKVVYKTGLAPTSCTDATATPVPDYDGISTSYTHTGLTSQTYGYRVCAIDNAGNMSTTGASASGRPLAPLPTVQFQTAASSGSEATTPAAIAVTLSAASTQTITVGYATANGTATAAADYTATSGTLTFSPNVTSKTINVPITNDTAVEGNETFTVTLSDPSNATLGTTTTHNYTIIDNDNYGAIQLSSATYSVSESGGTVTVTATRTGGSSGEVGVSYATSDGTATAGSDYTAAGGTLSWPDGDTANKTFTVPVLNDSISEGNETFTVTLSNVTGGATLGSPASATVTITDDDSAPAGSIQLSSATYSVAENNGTVTITATRTGGSSGAVGVSFSTSNGTATAGSDYTTAGGTLNWSNGDTANKTFNVTILNDSIYEGNETFTVTLSSATGGATMGSPASATVTITDDDPLPTGSILINGGAAWTKSTAVTLTATDSNPPVQMCISNTATCTTFSAFVSPKTWTLTTGNGTKTVYVWFKDVSGNKTPAPYTDTIGLDTTAPINGTVTAISEAGQIVLNWSGFTDALSGIAGYKVVYAAVTAPTSCATGTVLYNGSSLTYTHTGLINQTYGYRVCAIDNAGNISTGVTKTGKPLPTETNPPSGSITINNGVAWTKSATVTLALAATDESGITQYCISNSGTCTAWTTISSSTNLSITKTWTLLTGNGNKTVNVWFKDTWGNATPAPYTAAIGLDTTAPINGTLTATAGSGQIALSWSGFTDALSGIAGYKVVYAAVTAPISCATGTVLYNGPSLTYTHTGLINQTYGYRVCAIDNAGNISTGVTKTGKPSPTETNPPAGGSVLINNGAAWTKSATVNLALAATDESGITQYCISNTGTCTAWTTISSSTNLSITKTWTLATGNGNKTVNVWFKDTWGNATPAPYTAAIGLDTTAPINGTLTATAGSGQIALSWSGFTDALSGIAGYKVVYAAVTAPISCATGTVLYNGTSLTYTHTGLINQTYGYRVCAIDNAGNISTGVTKTGKPSPTETNPPNGSITINNGSAWTKSATVTLALAATDESGITQYCISNTGTCTAWTTISSSTNLSITKTWTLLTGNGSKTVNVWFKDTWGNATPAPYTATIGLDTTAPINGALTATPGSGQMALSWTGFNDVLSGIGSYKLVFSTTSTPMSCSTGTVLYSNGLNTTYSHTGLNSSLTYYYRVCAIDGAGGISTGATKSAKPLL